MDQQVPAQLSAVSPLAVIGPGRMGRAIAGALGGLGVTLVGPLGRDADIDGCGAVLLCVPDEEIASAAQRIPAGPFVGHCSGASTLAVLAAHPLRAFSVHPLMTVTSDAPAGFAGASAAVAGSSPEALALATDLARLLGMEPFTVEDHSRTTYHAAACVASNFLVTLEEAAERLAADAGVPRSALVPLVRATVENWASLGPQRALTGPVARGDDATVHAQREAVANHEPDLLELFDAMVDATRELAGAAPLPRELRILRTVAEVRAALAEPRRASARIGLVPTMGALHEGHLSLIRRARSECDVVAVTLFVNPSQFDDASDLARYPRDEARDRELAASCGADLLFAPSREEIYPAGFATTVSVSGLTSGLEGAHRGPTHFDGVTTIVTKLLNIVSPDVAYFGAKDFQQARVIQQLVRDLDIPVRIELCPTVREADGLAMSSRNNRLTAEQRTRAAAIHRALQATSDAVANGESHVAAALIPARAELIHAGIDTDYLEVVSTDTLQPLTHITEAALAVVAGRLGNTRLIDNLMLSTTSVAGSNHKEK